MTFQKVMHLLEPAKSARIFLKARLHHSDWISPFNKLGFSPENS